MLWNKKSRLPDAISQVFPMHDKEFIVQIRWWKENANSTVTWVYKIDVMSWHHATLTLCFRHLKVCGVWASCSDKELIIAAYLLSSVFDLSGKISLNIFMNLAIALEQCLCLSHLQTLDCSQRTWNVCRKLNQIKSVEAASSFPLFFLHWRCWFLSLILE